MLLALVMLGLLAPAASAPATPAGAAGAEPARAESFPPGCSEIIGGTGGLHPIRLRCHDPAILPPAPERRSSKQWLLLSQDATTRLWLDRDSATPGAAPRIWIRLDFRSSRDGVKTVDQLEQFDCASRTGNPLLSYDYDAEGRAIGGDADSADMWMSLILPETEPMVAAAVCREGK